MDKKYLKLESESKERYIYRMYSNKIQNNLTNNEVRDIVNEVLGVSWQESYMRGIFKNYGVGYNECLEDSSLNDELKELEEKKLEIEKLKIQYQDQKREYRNYLRMDARWQHIINEMNNNILKLNEYRPINPVDDIKIQGDREAVLILSDWHIGMVNNTRHNVYDIEIAKERMENLYKKVLQYCTLHGVVKLNIEIAGDMIHGLIHLTTRVYSEEDSISQTMIVSEMLCDFISKLSYKIKTIDVHGCLGNHSRVSANIKDSINVENFERLITWYMRPRLVKQTNVTIFDDYEEDIILYKVFDLNIGCVHGHKEKVNDAVGNMSKFLKIFIDELHLGHWHSHNIKNDNDMVTIINGSFGGADEYSQDIRKSNKPSQTLMIYNEEGRECTYDIKL